MAPSIQRVALAGASGSMGSAILPALLEADFDVTVLTRSSSQHTFPSKVKVADVNYEDLESLKNALQGLDALIITVATAGAGNQKLMIDAALAVGVKRIIPSEFGCDIQNPRARPLPVYKGKVDIEEYLESKCAGTQTTYTYIYNNAFLDWGIQRGFVIDVKNKKVTLYDGGNKRTTFTPLPFIAKGTVAVLRKYDETANRAVRLQGVAMTQEDLLEICQGVVGKDGWTINEATVEETQAKAWSNFMEKPQEVMGWAMGFLFTAIFGEGYGSDFSDNNDDELLGLKQLSKEDVVEIVKACA